MHTNVSINQMTFKKNIRHLNDILKETIEENEYRDWFFIIIFFNLMPT